MGRIGPIARNASFSGSAAGRRGFALLSPSFLDELRTRVSLSTLIGRTVPLRKAGNEFKACCPFHQEKTPSFWVNDQKGFYHCFGCGAHGDAIRWLTESQGVPFIEAVKQLADENGLDLPKPSPEETARQQRAIGQQNIMEAAASYFEKALTGPEALEATSYLRRRGVKNEQMRAFRIGYAPDERQGIEKALNQFSQDDLIDAGLVISVEGKSPYGRFRNRIMVPIRDPRGRIIAFGGRIVGAGEPKYLNSPDTALFDKSRVLFNLDRAGPASRQTERLIVVEGYFDVIALDQVDIRDAVAPMGTALTEAQLEQLWRLVDDPVLCFDGDAPGRKAADRAAMRAMASLRPGKNLKFVLLPNGLDPDDFVRSKGKEAFEQVVGNALPLADFIYRSEAARIDSTKPEQRAKLRTNLIEIARSCDDRFVADEFSRTLNDLFFRDFGWKAKHAREILRSTVRTSPRVAPNLAHLFVRSALYGLTRFPALAARHLEEIGQISIVHPELERWRDAIGEAVLLDPTLDEDCLNQILSTRLLPETIKSDICSDLRFGFIRKMTSRETAMAQLAALISFLAEERTLADEMAEQDEMAVAATLDSNVDRYVAIEARRQTLRESRIKMIDRRSNWDGSLSGAEGGRTH